MTQDATSTSPARTPGPAGSARPGVPPLAVAVPAATFLGVVVFVWLVAVELAGRPPLPARIQADETTTYVSLLADLVARLTGLAALGGALAIAAFTPLGHDHRLSDEGQRLARWTGRSAQLWFWSSMLLTAANSAYVNGVPMGYTFAPDAWWTFQITTPASLAWLLSAVAALATALASYFSRMYAPFALTYLFGLLAMMFVGVTGNVSIGLDHDWATDAAIWIALTMIPLATGAVAVVLRGVAGASPDDVAHRLRRYHVMVPVGVVVAAGGHAFIAWQQLAGQPLRGQYYGIPTVGFFVCLALLAASWAWRQASGEARDGAAPTRALASAVRDVAVGIVYVGFLSTANHIPTPRYLIPQSAQVNYLGYESPIPVTLERLLTLGRPNFLWVGLALVSVGVYLWVYVRVRRAGQSWPAYRVAFWVSGWALTFYLAVTGFWEYSTVVFSWHMFVHMTVNMTVPVLCVLGGPLTLARLAARPRDKGELPGATESIGAVLAYRPLQRVFSTPSLWLNYVGSLFLIYYTPLFPWLMRYHWAHQLMLLYFMVTGYLFFNMLVGIDNRSTRMPHLIKLALVISIMPFHAIFAVGILMSASLFGGDFYNSIDITWVGDLMADQNIAGQITWILGEIPLFIVIIALAAQWFSQDKADSSLSDTAQDAGLDDSFDAYNDMLAELAKRDRVRQAPDLRKGPRP